MDAETRKLLEDARSWIDDAALRPIVKSQHAEREPLLARIDAALAEPTNPRPVVPEELVRLYAIYNTNHNQTTWDAFRNAAAHWVRNLPETSRTPIQGGGNGQR